MNLLSDFKKFAFKGNVVDLAVGIVIGGAFGKIVTALVSDFIMPLVSMVMPSGDWRASGFIVKEAADPKDNVVLKYGDFLGVTLDFLIVAFALFLVVSKLIKTMETKLSRSDSNKVPETKECSFCLETIPFKAKRCKFCTSELLESVPNAAL